MLIAIGGSEASANPEGKTYTATIDPSAVTAGVLEDFDLTVTNESESTPLGAVNLTIPDAFRFEPVSLGLATATGGKSWSSDWSADGSTIELRADSSSDRLDWRESVMVTFGATGLQQFVDLDKGYEIYAFPIDARQANSFSGVPGNHLTYIGANPSGPQIRLDGVAWNCTVGDCDLTQPFGDGSTATFTITGACDDACGIIAIELLSYNTDGAISQVVFAPAPTSTDVRVYLTIPKDELTQSPSQYTFFLYDENGDPKLTDDATGEEVPVGKCHRDDVNCIEKIERTKTNVTWIFRVDPVDPRMDWR